MLLDIINLEKVRRAFLYFGFLLAALFVQNSILDKISVLGVRAMFLPVVAVAIGFFEGGVWGVAFGLLLGLFTDMSIGGGSVLFVVFMPIMGFAAGLLTTFFLTKRFVAFFIISLAALAISALLQSFGILVFSDTDPLPVLITGALQTLWSLPMIFAVFFPCKHLSELDLGS